MSDEVTQFLQQVERLRDQQIGDDEVRAREHEEFLAAKRERQARREERARSISPQKASSPANTPSPRGSRQSVHVSDSVKPDSPTKSGGASVDALAPDPTPMALSSSPTKENEAPADSSEGSQRASMTSRTGRSSTLPWQRRPNSRPGSRPLSMVAAQNATNRSFDRPSESESTAELSPTKQQIAQALDSKDATWFRQTADRGSTSAAYRRSQVSDGDRGDTASAKTELPGLVTQSDAASRTRQGLASPISLSAAQFDGAGDEKPEQTTATTPVQSSSAAQSPSPTKGKGGFVQSAMMKRNDSVKRWSVTSPPPLNRGDAVAGNGTPGSATRPRSTTRGAPTTPIASRPTGTQVDKDTKQESTVKTPTGDGDARRDDDAALPSSPTKTMDPKRWSPTKSSWLESALNRPESPKSATKTSSSANSSQPAWMVELNKAKADRAGNTGTGSTSHKHQVSIGGLMRQSPVGEVARPNTTGLGGIYSPPPNANRPKLGSVVGDKKAGNEATVGGGSNDDNGPSVKTRSVTSPSSGKLNNKPDSPPKVDFRANLKPRSATQDSGKTNEAEFKNVFGNLRRTRTQNYVAPDELKDNITRGKAALNVTDGPRKSEPKDEFKDAILKKRQDFDKKQAQGKGVGVNASSAAAATDKPLPEGLLKRAELGGKSALGGGGGSAAASPERGKELMAETDKDHSKSRPVSTETGAGKPKEDATTASKAAEAMKPATEMFEPATETVKPVTETATPAAEAVKPVAEAAKPATTKADDGAALQKTPLVAGNLQQGRAGGVASKLADRFNPALAGILARGPRPAAANGESTKEGRDSGAGASTEPSVPGPQLTHMTKGRARGPRRKAPSSSSSGATAAPSSRSGGDKSVDGAAKTALETPAEATKAKTTVAETATGRTKARASPETPAETTKSEAPHQQTPTKAAAQQDTPGKTALSNNKPVFARPDEASVQDIKASESKVPINLNLRRRSSPDKKTQRPLSRSMSPQKTLDQPTADAYPKKLDMKRLSLFLDEPKSESPKEGTHQRTGSLSPAKASPSPTKSDRDELPSVRDAALRSSQPSSPSKQSSNAARWSRPDMQAAAASTPSTPKGQPQPMAAGGGDGAGGSPPEIETPMRSPSKSARDVSCLLTDFFGPPQPRKEVRVDAAEIVMNRRRGGDKISSMGVQIFRILGHGKKMPVSAQNERVLFEEEMYVCAHNFCRERGGKAFEVYFWVGDEVGEAPASDALVFVQREARALGGRLVRLQQGKETAEFVQALGGVVIVRRGSSNKYDSLAPHMLCGRRLEGQGGFDQVAFDEVDFGASSLSSGFSYLVTQSGMCFLWKGKGSHVAEVSCARLVGMDMTLTGALVEYDEGREPETFWRLFGGGGGSGGPGAAPARPQSADHWRLKAGYDKYSSRLFCSDADAPQPIAEIRPFAQTDLQPQHIYVLDAFFEMYIVVGRAAGAQYASFRNALDFAQEYAILAAGMEDRPFVPVSTVVLEGIPRDMKPVFRKWVDARSPTVSVPPPHGLRRGHSLRVLTLTQALQAVSD